MEGGGAGSCPPNSPASTRAWAPAERGSEHAASLRQNILEEGAVSRQRSQVLRSRPAFHGQGWRDGDTKVRNPGKGAHRAEGKDEGRVRLKLSSCKMPALEGTVRTSL